MGTPVLFNWSTSTLNAATGTPETAWSLLFPELASYVTQNQATTFFQTAGFFCDNSGSGQVVGGAPYYQLNTFLNYITAHLAKLFVPAPGSGGQVSPLVGRIAQATEGSVTVAVELSANPSEALAFWSQTPYGLFYWTMSAQFRTGFYVPPCDGGYGAGFGPAPAYGVFNNGPGWLIGPPVGWG